MTSDVGGDRSVTLRDMTAAEFELWKEKSITSYASDVAAATGQSFDDALNSARQQFPVLLPDGLATAGTWLMTLLDSTQAEVGTIWVGPHPEKPGAAFIYDIEIHESRRGRGLGRAAMVAVEQLVADSGRTEIGLNVFGFNDGARHLYESLGYRIVSTSMSKTLKM